MGSTCEKLRTGQDVLSRRGKVIAAGTEGGKIYTVFAQNELSENLEEPKKTAKVTATVKAENKNYKKNVKEENNLYNLREELISYISEHKSAINVKVVNFVLTGKQKLSSFDKEELKEFLVYAGCTQEKYGELFAALDKNQNGVIEFHEFIGLFKQN